MAKYDVIIIGSGLGGLLCGNILSKEGYSVCVIEKNQKLGGCLQTFVRDKCIFSTGLNYTEGLAEGQILNRYFKYFGLMDELKLKRLDVDGFEIITFHGKEYKHAQGDNNFVEKLSAEFPQERQAIQNYIDKIKNICHQFPLYNLDTNNLNVDYSGIFSESAFDYIKSITKNKILQNVLAGNNLLYAGVPDKTPLYLHSLITYSYISSSWRLIDGSYQVVKILEKSIKKNGGTVLRNSEVKKLVFENDILKYAELANSEKIEAKHFISNIHPANTIKMFEKHKFTKAFINRINSLDNTIPVFSVYIVLKENTFEYQNYNHYYYDNDTVWTTSSYSEKKWPQSYLLYTPATSKSDKFADCIIAMTYMKYDELKKWENTTVECRGEEYKEFKRKKAEIFLNLIEKKFPDIRSKIKNIYTSTPLTYRDYTGTPEGSSYGILKDFNNPYRTLITPKTKIPNLFFTGQNLNIHGILGVTIGAVMTCGELVGLNYIVDKVKNS
ncbi:MAG: NAD(P)-binding protein [Bacteroidales bacterium]|nr:NAD(P)-binding protein [Bacteroidales bacterium]